MTLKVTRDQNDILETISNEKGEIFELELPNSAQIWILVLGGIEEGSFDFGSY